MSIAHNIQKDDSLFPVNSDRLAVDQDVIKASQTRHDFQNNWEVDQTLVPVQGNNYSEKPD